MLLELIKTRQSVREYLNISVEREKIEKCLKAAQLAPSACNSQPWKFIVVDDQELKEAVAKETFGKLISFNHFSVQAPVLVVIVTEKANIICRLGQKIKNKQYSLIDIGIAAEHFCLQATEEGLGTCMLGWFNEKGVKELLGIPDQKSVDLIITMGYAAADKIRAKNRKKMDEIRSYNIYSPGL